jgi:hypothetical protein
MNFKKSALASAITLATFATGAAAFDASSWEVSGFVKNETAVLQGGGEFNGTQTGVSSSTGGVTTHDYKDGGDAIKSESTIKLYVNGEVTEKTALHAELNLVKDTEAADGHFKTSEAYTQNDALRELYVDSLFGENDEIELRIGKQQVVWGTADGAKLLDIINPTDYREMAQNTMEDSRIPVWMAKLDMPMGETGSLQVLASQARENIFAGLNRDLSTSSRSNGALSGNGAQALSYSGNVVSPGHDKGNAFILKGIDTISGERNGFLNIVPDMGSVASLFGRAFAVNGVSNQAGLYSGSHSNNATNNFLVGAFNSSSSTLKNFSDSFSAATGASGGAQREFSDLNFGQTTFWTGGSGSGQSTTGQAALTGFAGMFNTNLQDTDSSINSTFEYMDRTSFATFDSFVGATSKYVFEMPDDVDLNLGFRYKDGLDNGFNYSVNYLYAYDPNPVIDIKWTDQNGNALTVNRGATFTSGGATSSVLTLSGGSNANGYGGYAITNGGEAAILQFTQTLERVHNLGGSFDYTADTDSLGAMVLRGEFLYQRDVHQPVIDRGAMSIGDLPAALTMRKGDRFKYVLGADVTVLTNMLVSGQFIQDRNLDFIDNNVDFNGASCSSSTLLNAANCGVYTLDFASMHMSNGFKKGKENKEYYSLFLTKPFGPNQLGRWSNIFMYEEDGGKWNRFDVEYSFTDQLIGTFELNNYWGDKDTQFGQLEDSSNLQLGVKYLF